MGVARLVAESATQSLLECASDSDHFVVSSRTPVTPRVVGSLIYKLAFGPTCRVGRAAARQHSDRLGDRCLIVYVPAIG